MDKKMDFEISGLFEDIPQNSHLKFDILLSYPNLITLYGQDFQDAWGHTGMFTYLRVKPNTDPRAFEQKLLKLVEAECPWLEDYKMTIDLKMQPLTDIHLTSHYMQEYEANGDLTSVNFLLIIAIFIIVMAWVNYINLSTARALTRAKEVGLRKVVGASRRQLMVQFFFETIIINIIAVLLALVIVELSLPLFGQITGTPSDYSIWTQSWFWITVAVMFVAGVILSGLYPVAALSAFKPVTVLKGKLGSSARGINLRKALVVFQFVIALALITGTYTVYEQISFMRSQNPGFEIEQTLVFKAPRVRDESYGEKFNAFKETLLKNADIDKICHVTEVPGRQIYWDAGAIRKAGEDISKGKNYQIVGIDYDFVDVFGLELAAGRNFSKEFPTDEMGLILNETAVTWMGLEDAESAVGEKVDYWGEIYTIVGILTDYHQQSLKEAFEPHIFRLLPTGRGVRGHFAVKVNTQRIKETVALVQQQYNAFFPGNPFDYFFLDDYYDQQYRSDQLFGKVVGLFSILAIIITALGIFGLSSFNTVQRTKEIGIRKVLGASLSRILFVLNKDILLLLAISFLVALPVLFYGLSTWLQGYANRMALNGWLFILPMGIVALITLVTVSYQTIKSATANPVEALRYE
jgi:putative ABC transport system permease protein